MDFILLLGRILFVLIFIGSGLQGHLRESAGTIAYARSKGAPNPEALVPATGVAMLLGSAMIILGIWGDVGALVILACSLPFAYFIHDFWRVSDPQERQNQMAHFMKNLSIAGGALILFWIFNQGQDAVPATLGSPLLGRW